MKKKLLFWAFIAPLSIAVAQVSDQAQAVRISEADIQLQDKYLAAVVQQQIGKLDGAVKLFQEVLDKNPKCDACAFQMSRLYDQMQKPQQAVEMAQKAVQIDPKNKWYQMHLAETYEKTGKDKEALKAYEALLASRAFGDDYVEELYYRIAYTQVRLGEPQKAIKMLDELEKRAGVDEDISQKKHDIYVVLNDPKKAAAELKKLADAFPQTVEYQHLAAEYFLTIGDKASANALYERVLKIEPNDSKAQMALAGKKTPPSVSSGGSTDANFLLSLRDLFGKTNIQIDEKIKTILPYVAKIGEGKDRGLAVAGLELADILVKTHANDAKAFALHADMLFHNGRPNEALAQYKKCLELNKTVYAVWEQRMAIEEELGLYDDLLKSSEQASDLFPNQSLAFYYNGLANERKGRFSDAVSALEQAVLMSAKKPLLKRDALTELGVTYSKSKTYDKSDKAFEDALKLEVKSPMTLFRYANALVGRDDAKAKTLAAQAAAMPNLPPSVIEAFGDYLFKSGDKDRALAEWQRAKSLGSKSVVLEKKIAEKNLVE
jgi:tetratricopeptide (TPR) repeat protein